MLLAFCRTPDARRRSTSHIRKQTRRRRKKVTHSTLPLQISMDIRPELQPKFTNTVGGIVLYVILSILNVNFLLIEYKLFLCLRWPPSTLRVREARAPSLAARHFASLGGWLFYVLWEFFHCALHALPHVF
jgi:hypothetical protein